MIGPFLLAVDRNRNDSDSRLVVLRIPFWRATALCLIVHAVPSRLTTFFMEKSEMNAINKIGIFFGLLCVLALSACTQKVDMEPVSARAATSSGATAIPTEGPVSAVMDAKIRSAFKKINADVALDYVGHTSIPGMLEVFFNGQVVFVSEDGKYLISGVYEMASKQNLAESGAMPGRRLSALKEIPASERIVFSPSGQAKHTVAVFTDVECGFCQKLHKDIAEYNRLGIAVEYLAFPRAGMGSSDAEKMQSVWCSNDRRKAMTDAKSGVAVPALACTDPVAKHHEIGKRIGLRGTPMIINADGIALPGYLPPDKLFDALEKLKKRSQPAEPVFE
jgi:thiol:disulfide interchange protein DsbC